MSITLRQTFVAHFLARGVRPGDARIRDQDVDAALAFIYRFGGVGDGRRIDDVEDEPADCAFAGKTGLRLFEQAWINVRNDNPGASLQQGLRCTEPDAPTAAGDGRGPAAKIVLR
jgi:hypothetical protein